MALAIFALAAGTASAQCASTFQNSVSSARSEWETKTSQAQNFEDLLGAQGGLVDDLVTATGNFVACVIT